MVVNRAKKKPITDEIATVEKDIFQYYLGKVLMNPDTVLSSEARGDGLKLYEDLERDDRVFSEMQKRKLAVVGKEWEIEPASEDAQDVKIAEFVENNFKEIKFDRACEEMLDGILKGFKPAEIMWDYSEGDIWIKEFRGRDPRRFTFDTQNNLRLLTWANMIEGEEIPERKFQLFRFGEKNNNPFGTGLGNKLYWPVWFKKNGVKFWAIFLEKFGQPTPWGKYPSGIDKALQDKLLDAIKSMQTDVGIITPENMSIELLEAARTSNVDSYGVWGDFWNTAITLVILGQTATTVGTPGKLGNEAARSEVRQDYIKADADRLSEWLNEQSIKWLVDYNFPDVKKYPKFWKRTELEEDLKPLAERDQIIVKNIGVPATKKYFYDTYGIPEPQADEELVTVPQTPNPFGQPPSGAEPPPGWSPAPLGFAERGFGRLAAGPVGPLARRGFRKIGRKKSPHHESRVTSHESRFAETDWVSWYIDQLGPSLKNIKADALAKIETYLRSQSSPPPEEEFTSTVQGILGDAYQNIDKVAVAEAVTGIYQAVKGIEAAVGFGGADVRAINFLSSLDHFYLSKFIENPDAQAALTDFLKTRYLEGGQGLFGAGDPAAIAEMKNLLSQNLTDLEGYQINRIVDTGVVKIKNWAHVSQFNDAGIAEIEIVEPTMECPFCAMMNGKIIQVPVAYKNMMDQANMTDEEYQQFLQDNPPELDGIENYVDQGMLPPYHPHCRGLIIKRIVA
jgi:phage gp29-like protein